jgi:hypothetical protein
VLRRLSAHPICTPFISLTEVTDHGSVTKSPLVSKISRRALLSWCPMVTSARRKYLSSSSLLAPIAWLLAASFVCTQETSASAPAARYAGASSIPHPHHASASSSSCSSPGYDSSSCCCCCCTHSLDERIAHNPRASDEATNPTEGPPSDPPPLPSVRLTTRVHYGRE